MSAAQFVHQFWIYSLWSVEFLLYLPTFLALFVIALAEVVKKRGVWIDVKQAGKLPGVLPRQSGHL